MGIEDSDIFNDPAALGRTGIVGRVVRSIGYYDGKLIYDVNYTLDGKGRRITPLDHPETRTRFLALFGCSFVFGHGVQDNETLPYYAGELCADFMPYNYGQRGDGPQQVLQLIREGAFREEIRESNGVGVYVYIPHHIDRLIGSMPTFNQWTSNFPYYYLDKDGRLVQDGTFRTGRPWRSALYDALWDWPVVSWFGISLPLRRTHADMDLMVAVLREARTAFRAQFPDSTFVVLIYYYATASLARQDLHPYMLEQLKNEGIPVVTGVCWENAEQISEDMLPDFHPRPAMHRRVAEELVRGLGLIPDLEQLSSGANTTSSPTAAPQSAVASPEPQ